MDAIECIFILIMVEFYILYSLKAASDLNIMLLGNFWSYDLSERVVQLTSEAFNINYEEKHSYWDLDLKLVIHVAY